MPLLEIKDLQKSYQAPSGETNQVIDIPHFEIQEGEQIALEGSSGSGKTTFLNLIAGILGSDSGSILLDGQDLTQMNEAQRDQMRANYIGYVFQNFNLLQGFTAIENVLLGMMFGKGPDLPFAQKLLDQVGLAEKIDYRPNQLSIGQQQRIAVARALANHPKLVIADEPTGNLDHRNAKEALKLVRNLCTENNAALLLVSHDPFILEQFEKREKVALINRAAKEEQVEENQA